MSAGARLASGGDAIDGDAHESALSVRAKRVDDGLLGALKGEERLPREQVLAHENEDTYSTRVDEPEPDEQSDDEWLADDEGED